ncbi:MAG: hypothetical protein MK110_12500 [Fuerstiella sp.]|nr:hypothetical protein [Fuerstiella sp.]
MKHLALLASTSFLIGCADNDFNAVDQQPVQAAKQTVDVSSVDSAPTVTSFDSGDLATLAIPEMECPFGCFPRAKDALADIDGVAGVELVDQEQEGVINDRRVIVTFDGKVDGHAAIAALDSVNLPGASFEQATAGDN